MGNFGKCPYCKGLCYPGDSEISEWNGHCPRLTIAGSIADRSGESVGIFLLVDTGAGANFLDSGVAERLGLDSEGRVPTLGVGGNAQSSFVHVDSLRIGEVGVYDQSWMASDFSGVRDWFEYPPSVVLGYDFLSRTVLEVSVPYAAASLASVLGRAP